MLEQEARRCYEQRCLSNIYHPEVWVSKPNIERERKIREVANMSQPSRVESLFECAQNIPCLEEGCYRHCSQQFLRGLILNYQQQLSFRKVKS